MNNRASSADRFIPLIYLLFFISLCFGFRAITSISVGLIIVLGIAVNKQQTGKFFTGNLKNNVLFGCLAFYLLQSVLIILSPNHDAMLRHIGLKSSIVLVPLAVSCGNYFNPGLYRKLMYYFTSCLVAFTFVCISIACYKYFFKQNSADVFYYHVLVSPFKQHAIQVSILIYINLVFLLSAARNNDFILRKKPVHYLLLFYFVGTLLLLSSKLVIGFTLITVLYYLLRDNQKKSLQWKTFIMPAVMMVLIILVLAGNNKISRRFNEVIHTNYSLVQQKTFDPGIYFDGVQFRLLQVRFVKEILDEHNSWLWGVSDNAQPMLDQKYISTRMYTGDGKSTDRGYLDFNTHNEFLESLLQSGIAGLLLFTFIVVSIVQLAIRRSSADLIFTVAILLAYCFNESILQRQYSITIFTFFPLFIYFSTAGTNRLHTDSFQKEKSQ